MRSWLCCQIGGFSLENYVRDVRCVGHSCFQVQTKCQYRSELLCLPLSNRSSLYYLYLCMAAERLLLSHGELRMQYDEFNKNPDISGWLEDAALFAAIDKSIGALSWYEWPEPLKYRHLGALEDIYQKTERLYRDFSGTTVLISKAVATCPYTCTEAGHQHNGRHAYLCWLPKCRSEL